MSASNAAVQTETGEEGAGGRKHWADGPPRTLLDALAQAQLTASTLGSTTATAEEKDDTEETNEEEEEVKEEEEKEEEEVKEEEEDSEVESDEERLEPRSDDDDTNFEESEDELREAVADSMKNLFVMEDGSSDEAEVHDGMEEEGGAVDPADLQQIQPEEASPTDGGERPPVSTETEEHSSPTDCEGKSSSDQNTALDN